MQPPTPSSITATPYKITYITHLSPPSKTTPNPPSQHNPPSRSPPIHDVHHKQGKTEDEGESPRPFYFSFEKPPSSLPALLEQLTKPRDGVSGTNKDLAKCSSQELLFELQRRNRTLSSVPVSPFVLTQATRPELLGSPHLAEKHNCILQQYKQRVALLGRSLTLLIYPNRIPIPIPTSHFYTYLYRSLLIILLSYPKPNT